MKLSNYSTEEIKTKLKNRSEYLESNLLWTHKDKRYQALINEFEKRVLRYNHEI